MNAITVTFPTVTYATKAKKVLARVGIHSKLIKIGGGASGGCVYALRIESTSHYDLAYEFKNSGIPYSILETK